LFLYGAMKGQVRVPCRSIRLGG